MAFTLYSLLQAALLCVNAIAVLHEERFLKNSEWDARGRAEVAAAPPGGARTRDRARGDSLGRDRRRPRARGWGPSSGGLGKAVPFASHQRDEDCGGGIAGLGLR